MQDAHSESEPDTNLLLLLTTPIGSLPLFLLCQHLDLARGFLWQGLCAVSPHQVWWTRGSQHLSCLPQVGCSWLHSCHWECSWLAIAYQMPSPHPLLTVPQQGECSGFCLGCEQLGSSLVHLLLFPPAPICYVLLVLGLWANWEHTSMATWAPCICAAGR